MAHPPLHIGPIDKSMPISQEMRNSDLAAKTFTAFFLVSLFIRTFVL